MSADVIIDSSAHPDADAWYRLRRAEPIGGGRSIGIGSTFPLTRYSLDSILDTVIDRVSGGSDLIIVGHGRETGLSAKLFQSSRDQRFRSEIATMLATDRASERDGLRLPPISVARAAEICMISEPQVTSLRAKMNQVRAKRLGHVAFRACLMGAWPDTLDPYREFFGCRSVSALDLRDTYGHFALARTEPRFDSWVDHRRRGRHAWHCYVYGEAPDRVAVATRGGENDEHSYQLEAAAESDSGFRNWRGSNLTTGGFSSSHNVIYYHACFHRTPIGGSKRIIFVGDPDYESHVVSRP
jgi:hypothetical protein